MFVFENVEFFVQFFDTSIHFFNQSCSNYAISLKAIHHILVITHQNQQVVSEVVSEVECNQEKMVLL